MIELVDSAAVAANCTRPSSADMEIQPAEDNSGQHHTALLISDGVEASSFAEGAHEGETNDRERQGGAREQQRQQDTVETIDGDRVPAHVAQNLCRKMYRIGFALLPLMWLVNVWLFWPEFRRGHDPEITKLTRRSAVGFAVASAIVLPWMLTFTIGQEAVFGTRLFDKLDASRIDLAKWGLVF